VRLAVAILLFEAAWAVPVWAVASKSDEGMHLFDAGRLPEARSILETAVREDPQDALALFYLGRTLLAQNDPAVAASHFEKAVALDPTHSPFHLWLGRAWGQLALNSNVFRQASLAPKIKKEFQRAVELDPRNVDARLDLMEFYVQAPSMMGGSLEQAGRQAEEIRSLDRMRGYRASGRLLENGKKIDAAAAEYDRAAQEFPESIEPVLWAENLWIEKKDFAKAFIAVDAYLARNPSNMPGCYQLGRLAALSGERREPGSECLKRYLTYSPKPDEPGLAWAHVRLGQIEEKSGDRAAARREYEAALQIDATLKEAREGLKRVP
jgi:tetratricopeptide (TPR) repeat protein